uniref:Uncharacterized protein n=1 Tax=Tanacetum cinerariifolium TaxID=118510 RepID=A0A6L2MS92_TANCI|nr:hypothetical protein [Tanacetum cinerariifolium]
MKFGQEEEWRLGLLYNLAMGFIHPYLGGASLRRVCSHGGSDTLLSGSRLANLNMNCVHEPCIRIQASENLYGYMVAEACEKNSANLLVGAKVATYFDFFMVTTLPIISDIWHAGVLIVANDDDDIYTEATPLASKIPVVDYKIHFERNKPYFKIIRADGSPSYPRTRAISR